MSRYSDSSHSERVYEYEQDARGYEQDARSEWCIEMGYDPTDDADHIEAEWRVERDYARHTGLM